MSAPTKWDELATMRRSVDENGSYVAPELRDNPIVQMCQMIIQQQSEMRHLERRVQSIQEQIGRGPECWVLAAWVSHHGFKASQEVLKEEGMILRGICLQKGIAIPAKKVSSNGDFPVRRWPIEAIREWWPGCCARRGWRLHWMI